MQSFIDGFDPALFHWRYLARGNVLHCLGSRSAPVKSVSSCGKFSLAEMPNKGWQGTDDQSLDRMPLCQSCLKTFTQREFGREKWHRNWYSRSL